MNFSNFNSQRQRRACHLTLGKQLPFYVLLLLLLLLLLLFLLLLVLGLIFLLYQISIKGLVFYQIIGGNLVVFVLTNSYCDSLCPDFISFPNLTKENEVVAGALLVIMNEGGNHHLDHYCPHALADSHHRSLVRHYQYNIIFKHQVCFFSCGQNICSFRLCFTLVINFSSIV